MKENCSGVDNIFPNKNKFIQKLKIQCMMGDVFLNIDTLIY
jgi:hypothetical protein